MDELAEKLVSLGTTPNDRILIEQAYRLGVATGEVSGLNKACELWEVETKEAT